MLIKLILFLQLYLNCLYNALQINLEIGVT